MRRMRRLEETRLSPHVPSFAPLSALMGCRGWFEVGAHFAQDTVFDPVRVPPFDRVDLYAIHLHREVEMVAAGEAGRSGLADGLPLLDHVAFPDQKFAQVAVDGL